MDHGPGGGDLSANFSFCLFPDDFSITIDQGFYGVLGFVFGFPTVLDGFGTSLQPPPGCSLGAFLETKKKLLYACKLVCFFLGLMKPPGAL